MLFNSYIFMLLFLPVVLLVWWSPWLSNRMRLAFLTLASYVFYGWWNPWFVSLLVASTFIDFGLGHWIHRATHDWTRRCGLLLSITVNLGLLGFFKYWGFFAESANAIQAWAHGGSSLPVWEIILPIGISFYTFQTMSYSIDIYRRKASPTASVWHFAAYVSLFPQLIAGPIVRYEEIDSQLRQIPDRIDWHSFSIGVWFFVAGMVQKVLFADTIAEKIQPLFSAPEQLQCCAAWFAMLGYSCQLYFDFAGYSNMAVGLGFMLGFCFPQNFDSPYKSANISDFWRRWHMSLSFWLRDYVYIGLGGNRAGWWGTCRNLLIVMGLAGLWHGAGWTFVLWGLYHGVLLVIYQTHRKLNWFKIPSVIAVPMTFVAVLFGWVLFRAENMTVFVDISSAMLGLRGIETDMLAAIGGISALTVLGVLLAIVFWSPNIWQIRPRLGMASALTLSILLAVCILRFGQESPFLYFQF